jgi:hypothetical protein
MPAQHGVGLHDDHGLFPPTQLACQEDDDRPIPPVERVLEAEWKLNLPSELELASYAKARHSPGVDEAHKSHSRPLRGH